MESPEIKMIDKVTIESIIAAKERIRSCGTDLCFESPILRSPKLDRLISKQVNRDVKIYFKADHLQPVGAFKIRGALNFALSLDSETRSKGLVTHSSGNHGAAVAQAGQFLSVPVVVVCPENAPRDKVERMRYYGAEIVFCEPSMESRIAGCSRIVNERGMTEIPPFNHPWTMSGQGTMALEVHDQIGDVDAFLVAVGGCGLISGTIVAAKAKHPRVKVYGAEPSALDDTAASLKDGSLRGPSDPSQTSICDALRVGTGSLCWEYVSRGCDGVLTVSDSATIEAMRVLIRELKQVTEPSGAVATAALLSPEFSDILVRDTSISRICVVICGGNIGIDGLKSYI